MSAWQAVFKRKTSGVRGVEELRLTDTPRFAHCGWAPPVILVDGAPYIAWEVLGNIGGSADNFRPSLKFGPGGRRKYVALTEKVVEGIGAEGSFSRGADWKKRERREQIQAFALALIDLLPTSAGGAS